MEASLLLPGRVQFDRPHPPSIPSKEYYDEEEDEDDEEDVLFPDENGDDIVIGSLVYPSHTWTTDRPSWIVPNSAYTVNAFDASTGKLMIHASSYNTAECWLFSRCFTLQNPSYE